MKLVKRIQTIVLAFVLILSLAGCAKDKDPDNNITTTTTTDTQEVTTTTTENEEAVLPTEDRAGNSIEIPEDIKTIVSLAPAITRILVDLGFGDELVAIDTNSAGIDGVPKGIIEFDMLALDVEVLTALDPDIIFASSMSDYEGNDLFKAIKDLGVCVASIPSSESIQGIKDDVIFVSSAVKAIDRGQAIVGIMEEEIEKISEIGETITNKKSVHFEIAAAPYIYSTGTGTFLNEMIEIIGAVNVYNDQAGWLPITEEAAIAANPDVILTNVNYIEDAIGEIKARQGWNNVKAIQNGEVYYIDAEASAQPCHHIVIALRQMAKAVYPDLYE
ncbi:MAG: ABC-type Fe3+-hydroxamate transport system, periplasmic component [Clostridiales bacterium]|jgi:iron complex transport system substrate-binding protein|nr:ABC-type Fe3+-hydroxamate transport system, periplasmic component [Clostridiales bacterium]